MKRYITERYYGVAIKVVEIVRETDKCYYLPGYRPGKEARRLKDTNYHETWAAARASVIERAEERVRRAQDSLDSAQNDLTRALLIPEVEP